MKKSKNKDEDIIYKIEFIKNRKNSGASEKEINKLVKLLIGSGKNGII